MSDAYLEIANDKPTDVVLGGGLLTLVEPSPGREEAYNRWYEDDHFYSGATVGPWVFAARRWIRTDLERFGSSPAASSLRGSYIGTYWHIAGQLENVERWALDALAALTAEGRGTRDRTHVYTGFHELAAEQIFDPAPMKSIHALDHPYPGLGVEPIDAPSVASRTQLIDWLRDEFVPSKATGVGQCLIFTPKPFRADLRDEMGWEGQDPATRVCLLWFLKDDPHETWPGAFADHQAEVAESAKGELVFLASFIPTKPGTSSPLGG